MKASSWIIIAILAIAAIIMGIMWSGSNGKLKALQEKNLKLSKDYEVATATLNDIQTSLDTLDKDLLGSISPNEELPGTAQDRRTRLLNNIATMRSQIESDKKKISTLEAQLAASKGQLKGVQAMIDKLKSSVADKEAILSQLQSKLNTMSETLESERRLSAEEIAARERTIASKENQLTEQELAMNTMYYIVGTRKDLISKGIVDRKGGLLGIGKVSTVNAKYDTSKFTMFNLLETQTITFDATKNGYSLLSDQAASSYKVERAGGKYNLNITDPQSFRRHKYVVIELR